ncbi:MAG: iron ABC transporter permease, partial [Candidatus Heimdallarchaeota archaeon]|nr:iron ABC transporter permease [Candidatus Heimdallarchaeota archaeon]
MEIRRIVTILGLTSVLFGFLGYFFYWPLYSIVSLVFDTDSETILQTFTQVLFLRFFLFTILQTLITLSFTLLIGVPTGYVLARLDYHFEKLTKAAITVPFLFPPLVILLGFVLLFGSTGYIPFIFGIQFNPFSFWGIVFAHTIYNIAVMARITEGAFASEPSSLHDLANTLGVSSWTKFRTITLPHILPSVYSALLLVFLYTFNSFAIVLLLGQVKLQTLEVMIYKEARLLNFESASVLALFQLSINFLVIFLYSRKRVKTVFEHSGPPIKNKSKKRIASFYLLIVILVTWSPIISVIQNTVIGLIDAPAYITDQLFSGSYDRFLGTSSVRVLINTLFFAASVSILTIVLSTIVISLSYYTGHRKWADSSLLTLTLLPMGTSAITLSFAILLTYREITGFSDTIWIFIIGVQTLAALPFASRVLLSSWQRVPKGLIDISHTLGGSSWKTSR